jgi:hypothetical protein
MFDGLSSRDARPIALLKKSALILLALFAVTGAVSAHRAYYQVRSLELQLTDHVLGNGSVIQTALVGSGRTTIDVRLELIQGSHSETLAVQRVPGNEWAFFDPRPRRASQRVVVTPEDLARFMTGAAKVRATATGRPQWTRLPPPTVREIAVEIRRQ